MVHTYSTGNEANGPAVLDGGARLTAAQLPAVVAGTVVARGEVTYAPGAVAIPSSLVAMVESDPGGSPGVMGTLTAGQRVRYSAQIRAQLGGCQEASTSTASVFNVLLGVRASGGIAAGSQFAATQLLPTSTQVIFPPGVSPTFLGASTINVFGAFTVASTVSSCRPVVSYGYTGNAPTTTGTFISFGCQWEVIA